MVMGDFLEAQGYELLVAANGLEALEKAAEHCPNLIIIDIQMPIMDGLEAIRRLRADARFVRVPILALTALAMPGDRERCLEAGANEYLSKPVGLTELAKISQKLLKEAAA
jgi:CheY-like chemotaxis protein